MLATLRDSILQIGLNDVVDISVISVLIFIVFRILRQNIHRRVLAVFFAIAALYLLARTYQWQLTLRLIEIIAFSATVGFILVFQEDIRRFLESSLFSIFSTPRQGNRTESCIRALMRASEIFSQNKIGALIVIVRKVPVTHIIRGGNRLDGEVSLPLLCSLFDPHSMGHDGALILKGSRITRFGVHLPLSRNHETTGRMGTRHAAALGLSELCDALILVVSEETGEIGLAENGVFRKVTLSELERSLTENIRPAETPNWRTQLAYYLRDTWAMKIVSVIVSLVLWISFVSPGNIQIRTLNMPVSLEGAQADLFLDDPIPAEFRVTVSGPEELFATWSRERQQIRVPVGSIPMGAQRVPITKSNIPVPYRMKVLQIEPTSLTLAAHETRKITVPIILNNSGRSPANENFRFQFQPKEVTIVLRKEDPGPSFIMTEPIDLSRQKPGDAVDLRLIIPPKTQLAPQMPEKTRVRLDKL